MRQVPWIVEERLDLFVDQPAEAEYLLKLLLACTEGVLKGRIHIETRLLMARVAQIDRLRLQICPVNFVCAGRRGHVA